MRIVIVHNVKAGDAQHEGDGLVELVRRAGYDAKYFRADDPSWKAAAHDSPDFVVAAGGDGTVASVARLAAEVGVPLAILPLGTANNIARALGQANMATEALVGGWAGAAREPFDLGIARGPWGTTRFLESVGAGLMAESIAAIDQGDHPEMRMPQSPEQQVTTARGVFQQLLSRLEPSRFVVTLDGADRSGDYLLVEVMNFGAAGPNLRLSADARPADGLLDVVLVDPSRREDLGRCLDPATDPPPGPALPVWQARHVTITCDPCNLHIDDKLWNRPPPTEGQPTTMDLSVDARALTVLVPHAVAS
jgi:diacylglycerol kinase family enzyme